MSHFSVAAQWSIMQTSRDLSQGVLLMDIWVDGWQVFAVTKKR